MVYTVGVAGAGTMGAGIAQVCAQQGWRTLLYDVNTGLAHQAWANIRKTWETLEAKGKLTPEQVAHAFDNLQVVSQVRQLKSDLLVEAIVERPDIKQELYRAWEEANSEEALLVSNTSSLSIDVLAATLRQPQRFAGLHFFNPAPLMKLVEIVVGRKTPDEVVATLKNFCERIGKVAVVVKDSPGFIVNRVARPFYTEAFDMLDRGVVLPAALDAALRNAGFKMGPCELTDLIGQDINYAVTGGLYESFDRAERFTPSEAQGRLVREGKLGKKSGEGFYAYAK